MLIIPLVLLVAAFVLAALQIIVARVNLMAAGLACFVLAQLLARITP